MIRAGRTVVDAEGLARLHGVSLATAKRHQLFDDATLPAPVSAARKRLWDREQAQAHAANDPIPPLPDTDCDDDLLEAAEAAQLWEIAVENWNRYVAQKRAPERTETVCGVDHWRRDVVVTYQRPGRGVGGGRPPGTPDSQPRRERALTRLHQERVRKVRQMLDKVGKADDEPTAKQVAEMFDVAVDTGRRYINEAKELPA